MNQSLLKNLYVGLAVLLGTGAFATADRPAWSADGEPLLKPGIAVHSFGVSPDAGTDGKAVLRLYNTSERVYQDAFQRDLPTVDTYTHHHWDIGSMGNIYGIAIDDKRNIYTTASANWSPGYLGRGDSDTKNVEIGYGAIGAGTANGDESSNEDVSVFESKEAAGTIYKIDANSGDVIRFTSLPQENMTFTHQVCEGTGDDITRNTGPGLGNIVFDKFHNQFFVSNFSDGKIYRIAMNGQKKGQPFDTKLGGVNSDGSAYGLTISNDGTKLYFGTIEIKNNPTKPRIFSVELDNDGDFKAHDLLGGNHTQTEATLRDDLRYTQNIGGESVTNGIWAAISDLTFTPDDELMVGVRVGCKESFASSYNHGGIVYLLQKGTDGKYKKNSDKVPGTGTSYRGIPNDTNDPDKRAGWYQDSNGDDHYNYDAGVIPLHPHYSGQLDEEALKRGPDDGYGGVAVWQINENQYDFYATSADIKTGEGVHGFLQFSDTFKVNSKAVVIEAFGYKSVDSSTDDDSNQGHKYDYKGIGGDVEVLSVIPVSIGSYVWIDDGDGEQGSTDDECLDGATVTLHRAEDMNAKVYDIDGAEVSAQQTQNCGKYYFGNLPEGNYRVCVVPANNSKAYFAPTINQNGQDNNESETDSNIKEKINGEYCSGTFGVFANIEPQELTNDRGDDADNTHDTWGNMTVDFGFIKKVFDLALIKTLDGDANKKYKIGDTVTFTITVKNQGDVNATDVVVKDTLPAGLELDDDRWKSDGTLKTPIALIEPGEEETVQIKCKITDNVGEQDTLINVAEIQSGKNDLNLTDVDSVPGNNPCDTDMNNDNNYDGGTSDGCDDVDPAPIKIDQHFDLALVKLVKEPKNSYKPGDKVTFTIGVANQGTVTGKNIQIRDIIPDGLKLADSKWKRVGSEAVLKTPISSLAPKGYATRDITFTIAKNFNETKKIINIAEIKLADNDLNLTDDDSNPNDNPCKADIEHNNDINSSAANAGGCDDVDPAWITVNQENLSATPGAVDGECDCAGVESNKVDATSLMGVALMVLVSLLMGVLAMRPRTSL